MEEEEDDRHHPKKRDVLGNLTLVPCFRSALLWGMGGGVAIGLHKYRGSQNIVKSIDYAMRTFALSTAVSWIFCRANFFGRRHYQKEMVERLNRPDVPESQQYLASKPVGQQRQ